jgi:hypothetical protein
MNRLGLILAIALPSCIAPAAQADLVVTPNANAGVEGAEGTFVPFGPNEWTFQWAIAASQFDSVPVGSQLTAIGLRLDAGQGTIPGSDFTITNWNLQVSQSLNAPSSLSATYANNIAADVVTVRTGALTIAANSLIGGPGVNPFFSIAFTVPYTYNGGDLLLTLRHSGGGPNPLLDGIDVSAIIGTVGTAGDQDATAAPPDRVNYYYAPVTQFEFTSAVAAPEPSSLALLGVGAVGILGYVGRRKMSARAGH